MFPSQHYVHQKIYVRPTISVAQEGRILAAEGARDGKCLWEWRWMNEWVTTEWSGSFEDILVIIIQEIQEMYNE